MLKPEVKEAALYALRSGDYRQGRGAYYWNGLYCAMGAIAAECTKRGLVEGMQLADGAPKLEGALATGFFRALARLDICPDITGRIINLNDGRKSFAEIADWLEETQ